MSGSVTSIPRGLADESRTESTASERPLRPATLFLKADLPPDQYGPLDDDICFVAVSPVMREISNQVRQIANIDIPVLLLGESGTGKEVVARLIHRLSYRAHRTFMKVNCAALPADLLESELFGHEAGAFTGAVRAKPGKFEICHKGTIFLDEIAEMPIGLQAKLLHVLQDGEFSRLGSPSTSKVDVRVLAATNIDIPAAIAAKKFRPDLYYRLNAYTIYLPPLRERREDIPGLLKHFMSYWAKRFGRPELALSGALIEACVHNPWPGNVRELENFVRRYLIVGDEAQVIGRLKSPGNPPPHLSRPDPNAITIVPSDLKSQVRSLKKEAERQAITRALGLTNGSRKESARMLNISLRALQYKIRDCGIDNWERKETQPAEAQETAE
jgi:two-component system, NtrC family, response regulator AtoC